MDVELKPGRAVCRYKEAARRTGFLKFTSLWLLSLGLLSVWLLSVDATVSTAAAAVSDRSWSTQGYIYLQSSYVDAFNASDEPNFSHHVKIEATGSYSLTQDSDLGAKAKLQLAQGDWDDRLSVFINNSFGNLELGSQRQISYLRTVEPPNFIAGFTQWDNKYSNLLRDALVIKNPSGEYIARLDEVHSTPLPQYISDDELKLTYTSPQVSGVTMGVSYAVENDKKPSLNSNGFASGNQENIIAYHVDFERD